MLTSRGKRAQDGTPYGDADPVWGPGQGSTRFSRFCFSNFFASITSSHLFYRLKRYAGMKRDFLVDQLVSDIGEAAHNGVNMVRKARNRLLRMSESVSHLAFFQS